MKQRFIPLEKSSKRKQKEFHAAQRKTWGDINPVTRKPKIPKAYDRNKNRQRNEFDPLPVFLHLVRICRVD